MKVRTKKMLNKNFNIKNEIIEYVCNQEKLIKNKFLLIDEIKEFNQYKVIKAMQDSRLNSSDFHWTTGYGYGDAGREKVEEIYSKIFHTEDALVRPTISSGTHALNLTLSGILRPGDELLSITGTPYDTLQTVIGITGNEKGNLLEFGIKYNEIDLINNKIDIKKTIENINKNTKIIMIQRSTGYSQRRALTINEINEAIVKIKAHNNDVIVMVDNCYGEFLDIREPTEVGADIMAGSLIKNPGGGLALSGGYIVGKRNLIELISNRITAPGIGRDTGLTFGTTRTTLQGLFLAPHIVSEAVKGALLVGATYKNLGFKIIPDLNDERSDIIQAIEFLNADRVIAFCKGIQEASAVDSYISAEPWHMPGYESKVIMASGGFIEGSSIELSADGPIKEPYIAYYQGGLTYEHCKLGIYLSLRNLYNDNLIE